VEASEHGATPRGGVACVGGATMAAPQGGASEPEPEPVSALGEPACRRPSAPSPFLRPGWPATGPAGHLQLTLPRPAAIVCKREKDAP